LIQRGLDEYSKFGETKIAVLYLNELVIYASSDDVCSIERMIPLLG